MAKLSQKKPRNTSNGTIAGINTVTKIKRTRKTVPRDSPPQRSSIYRGVTRHRWTGRYEAHLWDKNSWNESQNKKGRQVYLGAYDEEEAAAHSYDLAALKYWGPETILNFPLSTYQNEIQQMEGQAREEYIGSLRRKSSGFSRGVSKYRGVARHHHNGRWEARIGRVFGNKYLYLGTYATQEEAAIAYDMAAIEYRGLNAVTNFDLSRYIKWLRPNTVAATGATQSLLQATTEPNPIVEAVLLTPTSDHNYASGSTNYNFQQASGSDNISFSQLRPANVTSALELLLHSSKFKEMMTMTSSCPLTAVGPQPTKCNNADDDVQTMFDTHSVGSYLDQGQDQELFGELIHFMPPMLQFDFDT